MAILSRLDLEDLLLNVRSQAVTLRDRVCSTSFYKVQSYTQCFVVLAIQFSVQGGRHLDTAQIYGNHKAASWLRGSVFLPRSPFGGWVLLQVFEGRGIYFCHSVFLAFFLGGVWGGGWVVGVLGGAGGEALVEICIASTLIFDTSPEGKVPKCGWRRTRAKRVHDRQTFHNDWGSLDPESPFVVTPGRPAAHAHSEPQPSRPRLNPELQAAKTEHHHRRKNS